MKIDLQITFDDLSEECKKEIKRLEDAGYEVNIIYPTIEKQKKGDDWNYPRPYYYPPQEWAPFGPLIGGPSRDPYEVKCCCKGIAR